MSLPPGAQLGSYEIIALIGAGGMGEVYKARDPKLNRLVAIKVLPAALAENRDFLARFDREAKAVAALSHPNVLGIFDLATQDGLTFAVMELLEGDSLRDRLKGGALPPKRALEIATELAQGLGAAHEKGIIHRDVKPENIFLTKEGRVKILDFGLAKQTAKGAPTDLATEAMSLAPNGTEAGMVLGTAGYMSPEQVKGEPADHRADIFAFGVVLYEMLSGQRPFKGESSVQTMNAILEQDPPALVAARGPLPPALERLVSHCLEKHPEGRFQSMKDIAYDLQNLSTLTADPAAQAKGRRPHLKAVVRASLISIAATLALVGMARFLHLPPFGPPDQPTFTRLTFAPGTVDSAFFGPDGRTVYFTERLLGGKPEIFVLHPDNTEPKALGLTDAILLGVSADNELALMREPRSYVQRTYLGMLAHVSGTGGSPRDIQGNIQEAVWDGPGQAMLVNDGAGQNTLEFPAGRVLVKADPSLRLLSHLRLSRDRERLALVDSDSVSRTEIVTYDRSGRRTVRHTKVGDANGDTFTGLAWGPGGELWLSERTGDQTDVWALTPGGRRRLLWRGDGIKALMDVSPEGRMLLADHQVRRGALVQKAGEAQARDVSVAGTTQVQGLSADGRALLLMESPNLDGGSRQDLVYLNRMDGTPALRMAKGTCQTISQDGRWVQMSLSGFTPEDLDPSILAAFQAAGMDPRAALDPMKPLPYLLFVPTGAERPLLWALPPHLDAPGYAYLHPDGKRIIFSSDEDGQSFWYVMDRQGGVPRKVTGPGLGQIYAGLQGVSPDGSRLIVAKTQQEFCLQPLDGGPLEAIRGMRPWERPMGWSRDQKALYVRSPSRDPALTVWRLELATGTRRELFHFYPGDPSGLISLRGCFTDLDGKVFAVTYHRQLSQLYLVEGVQ